MSVIINIPEIIKKEVVQTVNLPLVIKLVIVAQSL